MTPRTNLATRPFYNVRAVQVAIGVLALVVIAFTLFNIVELMRLRGSESALGSHASDNEAQAQRLRAEAQRIRTQIDQKELEAVSAAAREANAIIDRRAFSWTGLFEQIEETLPADVRITTVQPRLDEGVFKVTLEAQARRTEDVADFIDALEGTGAFREVVPLRESVTTEGLIVTTLDTIYTPPPRSAAEGEAPARDATGGAR
jgi:type IV pilus assembly protein PilN